MHSEINKDRCIRCGICAEYCLSGILIETPNGIDVFNPDNCFECELCVELCYEKAIRMVE